MISTSKPARKAAMFLIDWFSPRKKSEAMPTEMPSSGLSRLESTRPLDAGPGRLHDSAQPANRKQERMARRELLYAVVREAMVRAGVLISNYKFKVLSLDPRGRRFLVMVDLAQGPGNDTNRLAEIEAMVAQTAKARHDILVTAVYWRTNEHVAVGDPARSRPVERYPATGASPSQQAARPARHHEAVQPDESTSLRKALTSNRGEQTPAAAAVAANTPAASQSYTLLTGFEDTEMPGEEPTLSGTQYGELR